MTKFHHSEEKNNDFLNIVLRYSILNYNQPLKLIGNQHKNKKEKENWKKKGQFKTILCRLLLFLTGI